MSTPAPHPAQALFRIDSFTLPEASREAFLSAMHQNMAFIRTLPGFQGHRVFEKQAGEAPYNLVTVATWESREALEAAGREVRAHYQRIGFDMPEALKRWGVVMLRADYGAPADLQ